MSLALFPGLSFGVQDKGVLGKWEGEAPAKPSQDHASSGGIWHQPFPEEWTRMSLLAEETPGISYWDGRGSFPPVSRNATWVW